MGLPSFRVSALRRREQHPNLLAAWGFDEGSGTVARDSSEHNLPLTVDAGITWPAGHSGGTGLGNTGIVGSAHRTWDTLSSPVTLMGWARPLDLTAGDNRPLFGIWNGIDPNADSCHFALWAQRGDFPTHNVLQGNVRVSGGLVSINHTALTLNTWVHLALSYDGSDIRLFRNGVEVATVPITGSITPGSFFFLAAPQPTNAEIDDVRIFNTALDAAQVAGFMNDPVAP